MPTLSSSQKARLNLRPSIELRDQIFGIARADNTTAGEVIRRAIRLYAICRQITPNQELFIIDTTTGEKPGLSSSSQPPHLPQQEGVFIFTLAHNLH